MAEAYIVAATRIAGGRRGEGDMVNVTIGERRL